MPQCWVGVGGNQGNFPLCYTELQQELSVHPELSELRCSRLYRTAPMGAEAGSPFFNAVIGFQTSHLPEPLLDLLQSLESHFGRKRTIRWGPRTLDLDLLYYGDHILSTPRLTVPHPGRICRRFVLDPLAAVTPDWLDPVFQVTAAELLAHLTATPRRLTLITNRSYLLTRIEDRIHAHWPDVKMVSGPIVKLMSGLILLDDTSPEQAHELSSPLKEILRKSGKPFYGLIGHDSDESFQQAVFDAATAAFEIPSLLPEDRSNFQVDPFYR